MDGIKPRIVLIAPKGDTCNREKSKGNDGQAFRQALVQSGTLWKYLVEYFPNHDEPKDHIDAVNIPIQRRINAAGPVDSLTFGREIKRGDENCRIGEEKPCCVCEKKRV